LNKEVIIELNEEADLKPKGTPEGGFKSVAALKKNYKAYVNATPTAE